MLFEISWKNLLGFCGPGRLCAGAGVTCLWHSSSSWTCLSGGSIRAESPHQLNAVLALIGDKNYYLWFLHGFLCCTAACIDNFTSVSDVNGHRHWLGQFLPIFHSRVSAVQATGDGKMPLAGSSRLPRWNSTTTSAGAWSTSAWRSTKSPS